MSATIGLQKAPNRASAAQPLMLPASITNLPGLVLFGLAMSLVQSLKITIAVLQNGTFFDTDDAMRLSQARDWLGGQAWFDLSAHRLDAPHGVIMHWSRLVDVPIAALLGLFGALFDASTSERITRIVFPLVLLTLLFILTARIARLMTGAIGPALVVLLVAFGGAATGYFQPGRLDHDHISIVLLLWMVLSLMQALDPRSRFAAYVAGALVAAQLAVSLETLPFVICATAVLPAAWIMQGGPMRENLQRFAIGLLLALPLFFAAVVAPSHYFEAACDSFSIAHLLGAMVGAGLCLGLALATGALATLPARIAAGLAAGAGTIGVVWLAYPACIGDPYAGVDPLLAKVWLSHVQEAMPLLRVLRGQPGEILSLLPPLVFGLLGMVIAAFRARGVMQARWLALSALVLSGIATSFWEVRALGEVLPLAVFGCAWLLAILAERLFASQKAYAGIALVLAAVMLTPIAYAQIFVDKATSSEENALAASGLCAQANSFTALATLAPGVALTPIDTGAFMMARTQLGILAAPFHRDTHGLTVSIKAFSSAPERAKAIVQASGARYLIFCPHARDMGNFEKDNPSGLAMQLEAGHVPEWLTALPLATPYKVFSVKIAD